MQDGTFQPKQQAAPEAATGGAATAGCPADLAARGRYAIRPTAVTEIDALTKHTPTIGCHYVLLSMQRAVYPPLYFHNGGIKAMLAVMREHVKLVKTVADPNTYVVASDCGPLQPHLSLDCSDVRLGGPPRHSDATVAPAAAPCAPPAPPPPPPPPPPAPPRHRRHCASAHDLRWTARPYQGQATSVRGP